MSTTTHQGAVGAEKTERFHKRPFGAFAPGDTARRKHLVVLPMDVILAVFRERLEYYTSASDPDAATQSAGCELEKAMGIYPNLDGRATPAPRTDGGMTAGSEEHENLRSSMALLLDSSHKADVAYTRMLAERDWKPNRAHIEGARNAIRTAVEAGRHLLATPAPPASSGQGGRALTTEHDPVPLRERVRDTHSQRTYEVLVREATIFSNLPLKQGDKVVLLRDMTNARGGVITEEEMNARFVSVDPSEPVERSKLHVVKPEDDRHG